MSPKLERENDKLSPEIKLIMKRSNYPKEIIDQISAKKEREFKIKADQLVIDKERIDFLLTKEYNEEAFSKLKRDREKEFMSC